MSTIFRQLFDRVSCTYTYLLADESTRKAVLIDTVHEHYDRDRKLLRELELELVHTIDTHVHADHVTGAARLRAALGSTALIPELGGATGVDRAIRHGEAITVGALRLEARSTPGHTNGCTSYYEPEAKRVFTGDTLFVRGCGRTDFQQGDSGTLYDSVHGQLYSLDDEVWVYPAHDYQGRTRSTIIEEKRHNPRLKLSESRDDFIATMAALNLPNPAQIHEAVPANLWAGVRTIFHPAKGAPAAEVDVGFVHREGKRYTLVDVRDEETRGGPDGAISASLSAPRSELEARAQDWDPANAVITICETGLDSMQAAAALRSWGFCEVASMAGGMKAWRQAGFGANLA